MQRKKNALIFCTFFLVAFLMALPSSFFREAFAEDLPSVINKDEDAQKILEKSKKTLSDKLGMKYRYPIVIKLVTGKELDQKAKNSPYKGAIVGMHRFEDGKHVLYMMKDVGKDEFYGTLCHEMAHGWQLENCPGQSVVLIEGLAMWVEYKCLMWDGAYMRARNLNRYTADPVYGVGYRYVQTLEDKYGENGVLPAIVKLKDIPR